MKKSLKVVVYPGTNGKFPVISGIEAQKKIGVTTETHGSELSFTHALSTEDHTLPVIDKAMLSKEKVELVFWDQMPENEINKLLNYNLEDIAQCGVNLFSVYHKFDGTSENKPEDRKDKQLTEKEKFEKKWGPILFNK